MATLNPVILPAKALKGGRHKVRISVAHNGEVRYINTDIVLDDISEFKNGSVRKRPDAQYLNTKIRKILNKYSESLDGIEHSYLSCSELVFLLKNERQKKNLTFRDILNEYLEVKQSSDSTNKLYTTSVNLFEKSVGNIHVAGLNRSHVLKFVNDMRNKKHLADATIITYIHKLKSLRNYVSKCGYVNLDADPFANLELRQSKPRDCWLTVEEVRFIRNFQSGKKSLDFYRDVFMLSYCLGGINAIDLYGLDLTSDDVFYIRSKTRNRSNDPVKFRMPAEAKEIAKRLIGEKGKIRNVSQKSFTACIGRAMRELGKAVGIQNLVYYSARKSFAQHALTLGIKESVIDYILGHSLRGSGNRSSCLYHYIYVTPEMATDAIRKVLDNLAEK